MSTAPIGDVITIEGGHRISGAITPAGNKNEAMALIAASLLTDESVVLRNVPRIGDTHVMLAIATDLGVEAAWTGDHEVTLRAREVRKTELDPALCRRIRASLLFAAPLLVRQGEVDLPSPGGDPIGRRRIDTHLWALHALGATFETGSTYKLRTAGLRGADIFLDEMSVTATENALMAAATAPGRTVIDNAASEPHVQQLARCLVRMGASIEGIGTNRLVIEGAERLRGVDHTIEADHIEVGSLIGLAAVTESELVIREVGPENLRMTLLAFKRLGVDVSFEGSDLRVPASQKLRVVPDTGGTIPTIADAPWPGLPPDMISILLVVATQAEGPVLIFERLFESRLFFTDRLIDMGARIVLCDPHRALVIGPSRLQGSEVSSPDIRAGIAMLIAGLCAEGKTIIRNVGQIDRGYEAIDERLRALGAHITRSDEPPVS